MRQTIVGHSPIAQMQTNLPKITLPANWDDEKDRAYLEERWRPVPSHRDALWEWMRFHYCYLVKTLDASFRYVCERDASVVHVEPRCLSTAEKINALLDIAKTSPVVAAYRLRLIEHLLSCKFAEAERERIIRDYRAASEQAWMYPVVEAVDYIGDAALFLDETMTCENRDFRELNARLFDDEES